MPERNAITDRLEALESHWNTFAKEDGKRALRWLATPDEARMVDTFITVQEEGDGEVPDLFIRFIVPFTGVPGHANKMLQSLKEQYEEAKQVLADMPGPHDWKPTPPGAAETEVQTFTRNITEFADYYPKKYFERLVLVLVPNDISDYWEWQNFLRELMLVPWDERVRLMLVDELQDPQLEALCEAADQLIITIKPGLDMPEAYQELAREATDEGPPADFRDYFVEMNKHIANGDVPEARAAAQNALAVAAAQKWFGQEVVVHMAMAGLLLNKRQMQESLDQYTEALKSAEKIKESEDLGQKLQIQAKLGQASVLISNKDYDTSATIYDECAQLAEKIKDLSLSLESHRMSSFCYEQVKNVPKSWEHGHAALDAAQNMKPEDRDNSTYLYAGLGLFRLLKGKRKYGEEQGLVVRRMEALAGPGWRQKLEAINQS